MQLFITIWEMTYQGVIARMVNNAGNIRKHYIGR